YKLATDDDLYEDFDDESVNIYKNDPIHSATDNGKSFDPDVTLMKFGNRSSLVELNKDDERHSNGFCPLPIYKRPQPPIPNEDITINFHLGDNHTSVHSVADNENLNDAYKLATDDDLYEDFDDESANIYKNDFIHSATDNSNGRAFDQDVTHPKMKFVNSSSSVELNKDDEKHSNGLCSLPIYKRPQPPIPNEDDVYENISPKPLTKEEVIEDSRKKMYAALEETKDWKKGGPRPTSWPKLTPEENMRKAIPKIYAAQAAQRQRMKDERRPLLMKKWKSIKNLISSKGK
ncbi:unnamed protein product, partial [Owenia fusiformis]